MNENPVTDTEVVLFSGVDTELLRRCQALRYRVYHHDLGLDTPDLDHALGIDVEARDGACDFAATLDAHGEVVGCLRMQPPGTRPFYAELEFDLLGEDWSSLAHVEGARFAVARGARNGPVPLLLFQAFRRYCRAEGVDHVLSVAIVRGELHDRAHGARLTRWLRERTLFSPRRGRPARGYELAPFDAEELAGAGPPTAAEISPMLRLFANRRTTLCSEPAYCRRFGTFNFLLSTRLG
ncbi:MAG: GNAT family N-acetyltransferase [Labilithrix sp.]|nr:GNAT family N-acetyltransferase [Labilithrix sp.]MBX3213558.1 GNAT family N-acetyltransferase [Labilithrix sp.]